MGPYHWYAEAYQWPPEVVRTLTLKEDYWLRMQKEALVNSQEILAREQQKNS